MTVVDDFIADTIAIPATEQIPSLDAGERVILNKLKKQLAKARRDNRNKYEYYETRQKVEQLDIAIPPQLRDVFTICGWPETVVDVLEERIDLLGYAAADGQLGGLDDVFTDNAMDIEASRTTTDSLIAGTGFVTIGKGDKDAGEPEVLVTGESPNSATLLWDYRRRAAAAGLSQTYDERAQLVMQSLYLPNRTAYFAADPEKNGKVELVKIDNHGLGRVPMVRQINKDRASNTQGRSEITRSVRYCTDAAIRTLLGMEVNREFYTTPMRTLLEVDPATLGFDDTMSEAEKKARGWSIMMGHLNVVPPQGDGSPMAQIRPSVNEFRPNPPTPYLEQIKGYSIMLSGQTGMPAEMFGFVTDNPTSGDAILKGEYRLVRRAERRIQSYNLTWREVALLIRLYQGRRDISRDEMRNIRPIWRNPAVPTRAAQADEAQKLIAAEVLPPQSEVTYRRLDFSDDDIRTLERDWRKRQAEVEASQAREQARQLSTAVAVAKTRQPAGGEPGRPNVSGGPSA